MIDEKKIKRDFNILLAKEEPQSLQEKLLNGFMEYINRQKVINVREAYFQQRMKNWMLLFEGMGVLVEVE